MATKTLTDTIVRGAKAVSGERIELWDAHTAGLCLRVTPNRKGWVVRYRAEGVQRRFVIGEYPAMQLADARVAASTLQRQVRKEEVDPAGDAKRAKTARKLEPIKTFDDLADAYLAACRAGLWTPKGKKQAQLTMRDTEYSLDRYIRPKIGSLKIGEIGRADIKDLIADLRAGDPEADPPRKPVTAQANKAHDAVRKIFAYGVMEHEHVVTANPALGVQRAPIGVRKRVLSDDELRRVWQNLAHPAQLRMPAKAGQKLGESVKLSRSMSIAVQLCVLLLQRRNEVAYMTTADLDLKRAIWVIPPEKTKGKRRPHLVPLPKLAVTLLREALKLAEPEWKARAIELDAPLPKDLPVFPSPRDAFKTILPDSITHALARTAKGLRIDAIGPHDLRRTGSTVMTSERLRISPFVRSLVLGHADAGGGAQGWREIVTRDAAALGYVVELVSEFSDGKSRRV